MPKGVSSRALKLLPTTLLRETGFLPGYLERWPSYPRSGIDEY